MSITISLSVNAQNQLFEDGFVQVHKNKEPINPLLFENKGVAKPISIVPWKQKVVRKIDDEQLLKVLAYEIHGYIYYMYFTFTTNASNQAIISIYEVDDKGETHTVFSEPTTEYEDVPDWHFFNRSTVFIIDNYLYFDMSHREDYINYYQNRYELGTKRKVENEGYLDGYQETMNQAYNHDHSIYAEAMNGELSIHYATDEDTSIEFVTKDFEDGFIVGNLSWSLNDKILYFDNHSTGLACIWRYNTENKELSKIIPEHKAEQGFGFSYKEQEYIIYIEGDTILFAVP